MFKRFLSLLLITLLLCGSTSRAVWATEAPVQDSLPDVTEPTIDEPIVNDGMPHGLILMAQTNRRTNSNLDTVIQVYTIDPTTGTQTLWSQFMRPSPEISIAYPLSGNAKGQLSADCTRLVANKPKADIGEYGQDVNHAGWIEPNGEFFDVSNALRLGRTVALGFGNDAKDYFYFYVYEKIGTRGKYSIIRSTICRGTIEGIKNGTYERVSVYSNPEIHETNRYYLYDKDLFNGLCLIYSGAHISWELPATDYAEPGKNIVIADYHPHPEFPYFPIRGDTSVLFDSATGTLIQYLPDGYSTDGKSEWGGVLSPDGTTVAYLTTPGTRGKVSLEFIDISQFFASGLNPAMRGTPTKMELADGPIKQGEWHVFDYICDEPSCILLDWRP